MIETDVLNGSQKGSVLHYAMVVLRYLLPAIAVCYILLYLFVAISRMGYPYELEWMEGRSLEHVRRLLAGQSIYPAPSLEFIPLIYTPLYFYISYIAANFLGGGFFSLRLVSFLASLGIFLLLFLFVKRETKSGYYAIIAVGFFAATYRLNGYWFDVARVDSLFLFLLFWGIYFIRFGKSHLSVVLASFLVSLSFLTKQTALVVISPLIIYLFFIDWKKGVLFILSIAIFILGTTIVFDNIFNHWYSLYTIIAPYVLAKYILLIKLNAFLVQCLLQPLSYALIVTVCYLIILVIRRQASSFLFYACILLGLFIGALPSYFNVGGYYNDLMPSHLAIALSFTVGLLIIYNGFKEVYGDKHVTLAVVYALSIVQLCLLMYNPLTIIPTQNDVCNGDKLVGKIADIKGDVLIPAHPYLAVRAGKSYYIHISALATYLTLTEGQSDNAGTPDTDIYKEFNRLYSLQTQESNLDISGQLAQRIRNQEFGAIILDAAEFPLDLKPYYIFAGTLIEGDGFWTYTGVHTRPNLLYLPNPGVGE